MIKLVTEEEDRLKLISLCEKTAFGCKISGIASAYGFDKSFANFWLSEEDDSVFCCSDDCMLISGTVRNSDEVRSFLSLIHPGTVFCAVKNAEVLDLNIKQSGDVLKKQAEGDGSAENCYDVNIRELFSLLSEVKMADEFEPFYLDISHKLRHQSAMVFTSCEGSTIVGAAVVSSISENNAVLSAVAVRENRRRQGIGSALVHSAENALSGRNIFVFREKDANSEFYKKLGFVKADTWVSCVF